MSQELTFQVQEFYSKVLWCAHCPRGPQSQGGGPRAPQEPGVSLRPGCGIAKERGFQSPRLSAHRKRGKDSKPSHLGIKEELVCFGGGGGGRESGRLLFPKRALNLIFPLSDPGLFRLLDGRVTLP